MYSTLFWATDGSSTADLALDEGRRLLAPGGRIIAFHCDQRLFGERVAGALPRHDDELEIRRRIATRVAELRAEDVEVEVIMERSHHGIASKIIENAEIVEAEAIVCGTRGLGAIPGAVLGSVAHELLHISPLPLIVVPVAAGDREPALTR
jgi:nucleotide-binding universal stress UspA family protein